MIIEYDVAGVNISSIPPRNLEQNDLGILRYFLLLYGTIKNIDYYLICDYLFLAGPVITIRICSTYEYVELSGVAGDNWSH